jgi:PAS domain S-box-containing protein
MTAESFLQSAAASGEPCFMLANSGEIRAANAPARDLIGSHPARLHEAVRDPAEVVDSYLQLCLETGCITPGRLHFGADGVPRACEARTLEAADRQDSGILLRLPAAEPPASSVASQYLAAIVESSDDAIIGKTLTGIITSWNKGAERMFGYTADEAVGQPITLIAPPETVKGMLQILERIRRGERIEHFETIRRRKNGERIHVSLTVSPVRDESGRIVGASKIARDISDRIEAEAERADLLRREQESRAAAEEALRLHRIVEEKLAVLVQASGALLGALEVEQVVAQTLGLAQRLLSADAYAVWRCANASNEWRISGSFGLSERYCDLPFDAHGVGVASDSPLVYDDLSAAALPSARLSLYREEGIRSLMAAPMRIHGRHSGTITFYFREPHTFSESELRIAMALANLVASAISTSELYEQQARMREEAQQSERRSTFLAAAGGALGASMDYAKNLEEVARLAVPGFADWCVVDLFDTDGTLRRVAARHVDPAKTELARSLRARYPFDPARGRGVATVLRTGQPQLDEEITDEMLEQLARNQEHLRLLHEVGLRSAMIVPMMARQGTIGAIMFVRGSGPGYGKDDLAVARQLGERAALAVDNVRLFAAAEKERAEAQSAAAALRQSNAELEQFAYVASHDLQEPLRTVGSYAQLLAQRYGGKMGPEADEFIGFLVEGAQRMSGLIEDLLRYSRLIRMGTTPFVQISVEAALEAALMNLRKAVRDSEAVITHDPLPDIWGHEIQIAQVFQNLIGNAIKYSGARTPVIHVSAQRDGAVWRFSVTDHGIGIEPQYRERIFGLFKRLHGRNVPGTGIGLATCRKIVEQHGGKIWVEPAQPQGSTFYFTLNAAPA